MELTNLFVCVRVQCAGPERSRRVVLFAGADECVGGAQARHVNGARRQRGASHHSHQLQRDIIYRVDGSVCVQAQRQVVRRLSQTSDFVYE
jgi:hypothetical protein